MIDEEIIEIQDLRDSGLSTVEIAKRLNKSTGTIDKYINQPRLRVQKGLPPNPYQDMVGLAERIKKERERYKSKPTTFVTFRTVKLKLVPKNDVSRLSDQQYKDWQKKNK